MAGIYLFQCVRILMTLFFSTRLLKAGSGLSLIHLCISYSYQHNASHKIHPQLVFVEWILFVCIVCFPLGPSIYLSLQPWLLSLKLLTDLSVCGITCIPNCMNWVKSYLPSAALLHPSCVLCLSWARTLASPFYPPSSSLLCSFDFHISIESLHLPPLSLRLPYPLT